MTDKKSGLDFIRSLSDQEKAEMFTKISEQYFNTNFGTFSKSQMDLLMFSLYIDKLIEKGEKFDDYSMSKQLGIMQSSIRQLKKKKELIYPHPYKWYDAFLKDAENAIIDGSDRIFISISDPNVYIELQHAIEEIGGYVEVQLNSKLLKIQPGFFIEVLLHIASEDGEHGENLVDDFKAKLNERLNKNRDACEELTKQNIRDTLKKEAFPMAIDLLSEIFPGGKFIKCAKIVCDRLLK